MNCTRNNNCKDALYQLLVYLNPRTGTYQKHNIEGVYKSFPYVNNLRKNLSRLGINSDNFDAVIVEKARSVGINISDSKGNKKEASNVNRRNFEKENRKPDNTINFKLQSKDSQINSICQKLVSEINKITSLKDKIYFVNAGRMNHIVSYPGSIEELELTIRKQVSDLEKQGLKIVRVTTRDENKVFEQMLTGMDLLDFLKCL